MIIETDFILESLTSIYSNTTNLYGENLWGMIWAGHKLQLSTDLFRRCTFKIAILYFLNLLWRELIKMDPFQKLNSLAIRPSSAASPSSSTTNLIVTYTLPYLDPVRALDLTRVWTLKLETLTFGWLFKQELSRSIIWLTTEWTYLLFFHLWTLVVFLDWKLFW